MNYDRHTGIERSGLALVEEALHLVRTAPPAALLAYYLGSAPFVLLLLYFWAHMSYSANAYYYCAPGAFLVALAFVWMKAWQAVYARHLLMHVGEGASPRWTRRGIVQLVASQALIHAIGFLVLIPALILVVPFLYVYSFLQNATILGGGEHPGVAALCRHAWEKTLLWPRQSAFVIWLLSPALVVLGLLLYLVVMPFLTAAAPHDPGLIGGALFRLALLILCPLGFAVTLNLGIMLVLLPELGRILFGIQSTPLHAALMLDSTLSSAAVGGMAYLLMDPLVKAAFVLRCFYSESRETGADLRVALRRIARTLCITLLAGLAAISCAHPAYAQDTPNQGVEPASPIFVDSQELERTIAEVFDQEIYRWRQPKERPEPRRDEGRFASVVDAVRRMLERVRDVLESAAEAVIRFIRWLMPEHAPNLRGSFGWLGGARFLLTALLVALLAALVFFLTTLVLRTRRTKGKEEADAAPADIDIQDENVTADDLPESGWMAMARDLLDKNEPRLALRALFLAGLAFLGRARFIRIAKGKSNREYQRELARRAHAAPGLLDTFSEGVGVFEAVWYGTHQVTPPDVRQFAERQERLKQYVEPE